MNRHILKAIIAGFVLCSLNLAMAATPYSVKIKNDTDQDACVLLTATPILPPCTGLTYGTCAKVVGLTSFNLPKGQAFTCPVPYVKSNFHHGGSLTALFILNESSYCRIIAEQKSDSFPPSVSITPTTNMDCSYSVSGALISIDANQTGD